MNKDKPGRRRAAPAPQPVDISALEHEVATAHQEMSNAVTGAQSSIAAAARAQSKLSEALLRLDEARGKTAASARAASAAGADVVFRDRVPNRPYPNAMQREQLRAELERLRLATRDCRPDMHEPDEQDLTAAFAGHSFDNAMGHDPATNYGEMTVAIRRVVGDPDDPEADEEWFNLCTLIALARLATLD